jgi:hypothetical protein
MSAIKKHRLALRRETLVEITPDRLDKVAGGAACATSEAVCIYSRKDSCITCK